MCPLPDEWSCAILLTLRIVNAAANHGYLPRNGILTIEETVSGLGRLYGLGDDASAFLAAYAIATNGNVAEGKWSIGGPLPGNALGSALGLAMDKGSPTRTTSTREMLRLDAMMLMSTTAMPTLSTSQSLQTCMHLAVLRTDTHSTSSELVSNLCRRTVLPTIHTTSRLVSVLLLLFLPRTILSS